MPAETFRTAFHGTLTTTHGVIYQAPAGTTALARWRAINFGAAPTTFEMWKGGAGNDKIVVPARMIPKNGVDDGDATVLHIEAGEQIIARAGAESAVTLLVDVLEIMS